MSEVKNYKEGMNLCESLRRFVKDFERGEWAFPAIVAVVLDHDRKLQSVSFFCDCCVTPMEGQNIVRELTGIIAQVPTGDSLSDCKGQA